MLTASTRLGPYEIVAPLGAGGMGEVYRARDTRLGREVAIKILPEPFANHADRQARFEREARAVPALSHPNILAIHVYGTTSGVTYAVMELLEGETLRSRLAKGPLPWREAVEIGAAIAEGLAAAHAKGIIHRDLKPDNLFLTADGRVKILDFGLARFEPMSNIQQETSPYMPAPTDTGIVMGTAGYMSPEQVRGQPVDARSDLFSFGCVLYEMVTGRRAFQRETAAETMTAILHESPPDATALGHVVPAELSRIIQQCLAKNPHQRLQSARDLSIGLRAMMTDPALQRLPADRPVSGRFVGIGAAVLVIGVVGTSVYLLTRGGHPSVVEKPANETKAIAALAVLPFENVGGDPEAEHLSDGIPESIIGSLFEVRSLKVRPFSSVTSFKGRGKDLDLQEVGRRLKVQAVLTGRLTVRKDGLALRVELVDLRDLSGIWSKEYDRKRTDIQNIPQEVARQVCSKLGLPLTGQEEQRVTKRYPANAEAFELYVQGRRFLDKRTEAGMKKGIECFERAIEKDRAYAPAYAGLADSYILLVAYSFTAPREAMPKAKEAALKALDQDGELAEAYAALAFINERYDWNWSEAERHFKRALELNPNYPTAHLWYAYALADRRRFDDALAESRRAQELDPLSLIASTTVGWAFYFARQYDQAIEQFKKTLEIDPGYWVAHDYLARTYFQKGLYEEASAGFQKAKNLSPDNPKLIAELGYTCAVSGKKRDAQIELAQLKDLSRRRYVPPYWFAFLYSGLGDKDQAFQWLERAYEDRADVYAYLEVEPIFDGLRSDPRVKDLLKRVGSEDKVEGDHAIHSVAVLPFQNVGGDPKTEFLSDGVADQIIHNLSQVRRRDLKVRPFTSVARYRGKQVDVKTFGRELNVQIIVTGTLRQQGHDVAISVSVVDVRDENELWGRSYPPRKRDKILDLQDEIAHDVAAHLRLQLSGEEEQLLTRRDTDDPEAYLLYREAMYDFNKFTPQGLTTAIERCKQAIEKDPKYALAYVALARCYILQGTLYQGPRQTFPDARKCVAQALKLDPDRADAHADLGTIYLFEDWNWKEAGRELSLALRLGPTAILTWNIHGFWLAAQNRLPEALASIQRGQALDPRSAGRRNELAMCYNWMRRYDDAIVQAQKALELDASFPLAYAELGLAHVQLGLCDKAIVELKAALDRGQQHPRVHGMLGYAYAMAGKNVEAQKVIAELKARAAKQFAVAMPIARIYAALGDKDQAFAWLHKACDERDSEVIWIKVDPTMDNLRNDPRFAQVVTEMHLPP